MSNFQGYAFHPEQHRVMVAQFIDHGGDDDQYFVRFSETDCYDLLDTVVVSKKEDGSYHLMLKGYGGTLSSQFRGYLLADERFCYVGNTLDEACQRFQAAVFDLIARRGDDCE